MTMDDSSTKMDVDKAVSTLDKLLDSLPTREVDEVARERVARCFARTNPHEFEGTTWTESQLYETLQQIRQMLTEDPKQRSIVVDNLEGTAEDSLWLNLPAVLFQDTDFSLSYCSVRTLEPPVFEGWRVDPIPGPRGSALLSRRGMACVVSDQPRHVVSGGLLLSPDYSLVLRVLRVAPRTNLKECIRQVLQQEKPDNVVDVWIRHHEPLEMNGMGKFRFSIDTHATLEELLTDLVDVDEEIPTPFCHSSTPTPATDPMYPIISSSPSDVTEEHSPRESLPESEELTPPPKGVSPLLSLPPTPSFSEDFMFEDPHDMPIQQHPFTPGPEHVDAVLPTLASPNMEKMTTSAPPNTPATMGSIALKDVTDTKQFSKSPHPFAFVTDEGMKETSLQVDTDVPEEPFMDTEEMSVMETAEDILTGAEEEVDEATAVEEVPVTETAEDRTTDGQTSEPTDLVETAVEGPTDTAEIEPSDVEVVETTDTTEESPVTETGTEIPTDAEEDEPTDDEEVPVLETAADVPNVAPESTVESSLLVEEPVMEAETKDQGTAEAEEKPETDVSIEAPVSVTNESANETSAVSNKATLSVQVSKEENADNPSSEETVPEAPVETPTSTSSGIENGEPEVSPARSVLSALAFMGEYSPPMDSSKTTFLEIKKNPLTTIQVAMLNVNQGPEPSQNPECRSCHQTKDRSMFSKTQLKKVRKRCNECIQGTQKVAC